MRTLLALLLLLTLPADGSACSCFPPELRAKTAQEALEKAQLAVYGRVLEVDASGKARVLVLESFKGQARGAVIEAGPNSGPCVASAFTVGEEALLLSFDAAVTACNKYPPDNFMLEEFRSDAARAR